MCRKLFEKSLVISLSRHNVSSNNRNAVANLDFAHRDLGDRRVLCQLLFDLGRGNSKPSGVHEFIAPSEVTDVSLLVHAARITADEPVSPKNLGLLEGS